MYAPTPTTHATHVRAWVYTCRAYVPMMRHVGAHQHFVDGQQNA